MVRRVQAKLETSPALLPSPVADFAMTTAARDNDV